MCQTRRFAQRTLRLGCGVLAALALAGCRGSHDGAQAPSYHVPDDYTATRNTMETYNQMRSLQRSVESFPRGLPKYRP